MDRSYHGIIRAYDMFLEYMDEDDRKDCKKGKQDLIDAQQRWSEYQSAECWAIATFYDAARKSHGHGSDSRYDSAFATMSITSSRAKILANYVPSTYLNFFERFGYIFE